MLKIHQFLLSRLFYPCVAASVLAVTLLAVRIAMGAPGRYTFLVWNLFLAWLPFLAALWAARVAECWRSGPLRAAQLLVLGGLWLLFLPNAPYLMTDVMHLPWMGGVLWFDVGMLLAFAWAGCILGVASLHLMRGLVAERLGVAASWVFVLLVGILNGVGIYLGRFLRWNSWDLLLSPRTLAHELLTVLAEPAAYPRLVGVSGLFAAFLLLGYLTLDAARRAR